MSVAILALRTEVNTVGERGLEKIEVGADYIHAPIDDEARQVLPHALAHDARLAVMDGESFFVQNRGDMRREPLGTAIERFAARKREIVGVPRVLGANRLRQARQTAIGPVEAEICQRR